MNYWHRRRVSRRAALRGASIGVAGIAGAVLIGCGGDDDEVAAPAATQAAATEAAATQAAATQAATAAATRAAATAEATATATPTPQATFKTGGIYKGDRAETDNADIHQADHPTTQHWAALTMDGLVTADEPSFGEFIISPMVASAWEQPDPLTTIFTLRDDVHYADVPPVNGRQLTAEDIVFSYERQRTDDPRFGHGSFFTGVDKMEAIDDQTFRITTEKPIASLLTLLSSPWTMLVAREQAEQDGEQLLTTVGSGPFIATRIDINNEAQFERNPNYWGENQPLLDGYHHVFIDRAAEISAFRAGEVHDVDVRADTLDKFRSDNPDARILEGFSAGISIVAMNNIVEPYTDVRVRQAIAWASDLQGWIDVLVGGAGELSGPMPTAFKNWTLPKDQLLYTKRDVQKSKQLLDAAGLGDGFSTTAVSIGSLPHYIGIAEQLAEDVRELNIDVEIEGIPASEYTQRLFAQRDYEMATGQDFAQDTPDGLAQRFHSEARLNWANYSNPRVDELFEQQAATLDPEARRALVDELQLILLDEVAMLFTYQPRSFTAIPGFIRNFRNSAITANDTRWNARNVWFDL